RQHPVVHGVAEIDQERCRAAEFHGLLLCPRKNRKRPSGCLALECQIMSGKRQTLPKRSTDAADYQDAPGAIAAMPKDFVAGFEILPHSHQRAQLIYATTGTMRVATDSGVWVVPPQRALWMPAGIR